MDFRLTYSGKLKSKSSAKRKDIQELRRHFHPQLRMLWSQEPLDSFREYVDPDRKTKESDIHLIERIGDFYCAPLVSNRWFTFAEIDVLFLRPSPPGNIVGHGGDLDNRIKTLLDALRMPNVRELPPGDSPAKDEHPFYCLLKDDALITSLSVRTDRLLKDSRSNDVELVILVKLKTTKLVWGNMGI